MSEPAPLLSIKAGIVDYNEDTFEATPKAGPGLIKVTKNPDDPMYCSFVWEARSSNGKTTEDYDREELLLFPGDAQWRHVPECTSGRVFELKFSSSGLRHVFWMQSRTDGKDLASLSTEDIENAKIMDSILQGDESEPEEEDQEMDESSSAIPASNEPRSALGQVQDLIQNIRENRANSIPIVSIADAISTNKMVDYVNELDQASLQSLYQHIPNGIPHTKHELIRIIQSPQFDQGLQSFDSILNEAGVGSLVASQLDIPYSGEGVQGYLEGVHKKEKEKKQEEK